MNHEQVLGIDLGGTNVRIGLVDDNKIKDLRSQKVKSNGTMEEVLNELFELTDSMIKDHPSVKAIGVGVPSVIDLEKGIVYDVQNIPSWKEVHLKQLMEDRYHIPVYVNNDANCFALGEFYFGKGKGSDSMLGLTIGTGLGLGVIIHKRLYAGANCGAGEMGMVEYLDKYFEYYACGQFFNNVYNIDGNVVFERAAKGDQEALRMYQEMGTHLGHAMKAIMYAFDPRLIIIGGSLKDAWAYYADNLWDVLKTFVYPHSIKRLKIELSDLENSGVLGAAALCYEVPE